MAKTCATCGRELGRIRGLLWSQCPDCSQQARAKRDEEARARRAQAEADRIAKEAVDQPRSVAMRGDPKCTLTTFWFSGCDPKASVPDKCASCSIDGHIVEMQKVYLLYTNINNVKVRLPVCKWCVGHTEFKGGQYHAGGDLRFAVAGVHPALATEFVKLNVNDFGGPIWSVVQ